MNTPHAMLKATTMCRPMAPAPTQLTVCLLKTASLHKILPHFCTVARYSQCPGDAKVSKQDVSQLREAHQ